MSIIISVVIILKAVEFNYMFDINRQWDRYIQEKNIIPSGSFRPQVRSSKTPTYFFFVPLSAYFDIITSFLVLFTFLCI